MIQTATHASLEPELQEVEERQGPFTFGGQTFTVVAHNKRVPGKLGEFAQALASLDIAAVYIARVQKTYGRIARKLSL